MQWFRPLWVREPVVLRADCTSLLCLPVIAFDCWLTLSVDCERADVAHVQDKWTALHMAAKAGHMDAIKVLLDAKANVEAFVNVRWRSLCV